MNGVHFDHGHGLDGACFTGACPGVPVMDMPVQSCAQCVPGPGNFPVMAAGFHGFGQVAPVAPVAPAPAMWDKQTILRAALVIGGLAWLFKDSKVVKSPVTGMTSVTKKSEMPERVAVVSTRRSPTGISAIVAIDPEVSRSVSASKRSVSKIKPVSKLSRAVGLSR